MKRQQPQDNSLAMLQQLGISLDPLQQMSGLVNLINASQAPGIQQQQFGEEMDYRMLQGDRNYAQGQADLQQRQLAEQNNQQNFGMQHGLQQDQLTEQQRYNDAMVQNKNATLMAAQLDRANNNKMDFVKLVLNIMSDPNGTGMVDPNAAGRFMQQSGFQGLINPQLQQQRGLQLDRTKVDKNISDAAFDNAYNNRVRQ